MKDLLKRHRGPAHEPSSEPGYCHGMEMTREYVNKGLQIEERCRDPECRRFVRRDNPESAALARQPLDYVKSS